MDPALRKPPSSGVVEREGGGNILIIWVKSTSVLGQPRSFGISKEGKDEADLQGAGGV